MSVKVKTGVEFEVIAPAGFMILQALKDTSKTLGLDLVITSGTDSEHSGPFDPHKSGEAYDVRSHDFDTSTKTVVLNTIMDILGRDCFYGFLESPGRPSEHYHIQRKIGVRYTVEDLLDGR